MQKFCAFARKRHARNTKQMGARDAKQHAPKRRLLAKAAAVLRLKQRTLAHEGERAGELCAHPPPPLTKENVANCKAH